MKNRTVYLAGKVTGLWRWYVLVKFTIFDLFLTSMGYKVYNPVRVINKKLDWISALTICLENLEKCDYVYFQPDFWFSDGARIELHEAAKMQKILLNSGYKIKSIYQYLSNCNTDIYDTAISIINNDKHE